MTKSVFSVFLLLALLFQSKISAAETPPPIRIAAASSLQFVLGEIIDAFVAQSGHAPPQVVYGSSGNLFRQISQGAPFDLFLSADSALTERLQHMKPGVGKAATFGVGRLVLFTNTPETVSLSEFNERLEGPDDFKIAIANPRHAPFGRAAQQALQSLTYWEAAQPRLVFAEKVSQAAQFVVSGATEFAILSRSLAVAAALSDAGSFTLIPAQHHLPVVQSMIIVTPQNVARALFNFILEDQSALDILQRYGLRD